MSIFEGLANIFGSQPASQVPAGQPGNPQVQQQQQPQQQQQQPAPAPAPTQPETAKAPVDPFSGLFTIDPNQGKQDGPLFNLDPEKFQQVVAQQNLVQGIAPEDIGALKEALGGNDEATKVMLKLVNQVGQNAFARAVQANAKLTETGVQYARDSLTRELPTHFKRQLAQEDIYTQYPQLQDEAVKPLVGSVQQLIQQKNPAATSQEVNAMVVQYFTEKLPGAFGRTSVAPPKQQDPSTDAGNFASWLSN